MTDQTKSELEPENGASEEQKETNELTSELDDL